MADSNLLASVFDDSDESTVLPVSDTERVILRQLMQDSDFARKFTPLLLPEHFSGIETKHVFAEFAAYLGKYDSQPSVEQLIMAIDARRTKGKFDPDQAVAIIQAIGAPDVLPNAKWIQDKTEAFVKDRDARCAVVDLIEALEHGKPFADFVQRLVTPPTLSSDVPGLDSAAPNFLDRLRERNQHTEDVIPFDIGWLNRTIRGVRRKTLNVVLGGTNTGKSLWLCHLSAGYMRLKLNVLYLSMEMDEGMIENRIFANLFNIPLEADSRLIIGDNVTMPENIGRLIVRTFPAGSAHTGHFGSYLATLKNKLSFVPDVIMIDYLALCASEKMKSGGNTHQYQIIGSIAVELRAWAQQTNTVVWSAAQTNREGLTKGVTVELTHTAGSVEIAQNSDIVISVSIDDKLPNRYICKISKRQSGSGAGMSAVLAVDRSRMRVYDMSEADNMDYRNYLEKAEKPGKAKRTPAQTSTDDILFEVDREAA